MKSTCNPAKSIALMLLAATATAAAASHHTRHDRRPDLVDTATAAGDFSTLLAALGAADLVDTLKGDGPFTVFAPTDEAFAALPEGTVDGLLAEEGLGTLKRLLTYHVLSGRVYAEDALAAGRAKTLGGDAVSLGVSDGRFRVDDSSIVTADLEAANGVVHIIDQVLLPPERPATAAAAGSRMTTGTADEVIRLAIRRGVPLFNAGDAGACAAIYEVAATSLIGGGYDLPTPAQSALEAGLRKAGRESDDRTRAWTLRYALDAAALALHAEM